jgi:cell division protein FtsL
MAVPMRSAELKDQARKRPEQQKPAQKKNRQQPALVLTPTLQRRWPVALGGIALLVVLAGLLGVAVFHTQLAERQIRIDTIERSVSDERERFDELRYRRAELRSPVRLAGVADELGMVPGDIGEFIELDPWLFARQLAAAGMVDDSPGNVVIDTDPLEQFSDVKRVSAGQP